MNSIKSTSCIALAIATKGKTAIILSNGNDIDTIDGLEISSELCRNFNSSIEYLHHNPQYDCCSEFDV